MRQVYIALTTLSSFLCHFTPSFSSHTEDFVFVNKTLQQRANAPAPDTPLTRAVGADPEDFSGIKQIVSIGDSYAAGIGAGARIDWACSRYDHSYPALLVQDERLTNAAFQFLACSGATAVDILNKQIPNMKSPIDALMLSTGGNDIGLTSLLNDCIFGWNLEGLSQASCGNTVNKAQAVIDNILPGMLDQLLTAAKAKLTPKTGRIYFTAYAKFFNEQDEQCNKVYWNFWKIDPFAHALDTTRRASLNALAVNLNSAIQAAASRAGPQVVFVNYDSYFSSFNGRFCEVGVTEPAPERDELLFFERDTKNPSLPWKAKRNTGLPAPPFPVASTGRRLTSEPQSTAQSVAVQHAASDPNNIIADGTFEGEISRMVRSTLKIHPSWVSGVEDGIFEVLKVGPPPADGSAPRIISASTASNGTTTVFRHRRGFTDSLAWLIPDTVKRVFHPRPNGHAIIASLVIYHMEVESAKSQAGIQLNPAIPAVFASEWTEIVKSPSCPLQAPDLSADSLKSSN